MRLSDVLSGSLAALFGIALVAYTRTFPPMPGQSVGPGLFPAMIGAGLIVFGAALAISAARRPRLHALIELGDWVVKPRMVLNFALVIADLIFYAIAVNHLGFFLTAIVFLSVLWLTFGVNRRLIVPMALGVTLAVHYMFYSVLRVPLPWGVLGGIAW
jgi:putative tricarboxylic transport membrane protein